MAPPTHPTLVSALEIVSRNKRVREAELRKGGDAHGTRTVVVCIRTMKLTRKVFFGIWKSVAREGHRDSSYAFTVRSSQYVCVACRTFYALV